MNRLSWLLYAADVIPNIGSFFIMLAVWIGTGCVVAFIAGTIMRNDSGYSYNKGEKAERMLSDGYALQKKAYSFLFLIPVVAIVGIAIPSKTTIYMIAASEMGETAVTNPEVREIFDAMKAKVKEYLAPAKDSP